MRLPSRPTLGALIAALLFTTGLSQSLGREARPITTGDGMMNASATVVLVRRDLLDLYHNVDIAQFCLGTLIEPDYVVTAQHCLVQAGATDNILVAALAPRLIDVQESDLVTVTEVREAPNYVHDEATGRTENDVAVIELSAPPRIECRALRMRCPATRPYRDPVIAEIVDPIDEAALFRREGTTGYSQGPEVLAIGWGADNRLQFRDIVAGVVSVVGVRLHEPSVLQSARLPVWTRQDCERAYGGMSLADTMVCAGRQTPDAADTCAGYSGGPLFVFNRTDDPLQRGVFLYALTSWGPTQCRAGTPPGVYVRLSHYAPWIRAAVSEMQGAPPDGAAPEEPTGETPPADTPPAEAPRQS